MRVAFIFPPLHGHLNPSLPVAKALVDRGHDVHYLSTEDVRDEIEKTGATFHSAVQHLPEYYAGRHTGGPLGPLEGIIEELGLDKAAFLSHLQTLNVVLELQLPGTLRFLSELRPAVLVYDALLRCRHARLAARLLGLPAAALLTIAGPGAWPLHGPPLLAPLTLAAAGPLVAGFGPQAEATRRLNAKYALQLSPGLPQPVGKLDDFGTDLVLVSTSEDLQDPISPELTRGYSEDGTTFAYVGPLLPPVPVPAPAPTGDGEGVLARVQEAKAAGRPLVLVSMGTLLVSNHAVNGWHGRSGSERLLSGCELCRAAWAAAFAAFGCAAAHEGPLLLVSVGPQPAPLGAVRAPANALCEPALPQVDILREGVALFLTHGGQNSFMEALSCDVPVVVCPGFGDQAVNARKAAALGVGLGVARPHAAEGEEELVAARYQSEVHRALLEVHADPAFKAAASRCGERLRTAGGAPHAAELVLAAAAAGRKDGTGASGVSVAVAGAAAGA